jgi:hypothetical protein
LELEFLLVLQMVEHVINKVETQHSELQDSHSTWLHTVEAQHRVMGNLAQMAQALATEQESAQAEADKVHGRTHGEAAEAAVEQVEREIKLTYNSLTQEDTQVTLAAQEAHQKVHQVADQEQLTQTIQHIDHMVDVEAQDFTD